MPKQINPLSVFFTPFGPEPIDGPLQGMNNKKDLSAKKKRIKRKNAKAKRNRVARVHNPYAVGADVGATDIIGGKVIRRRTRRSRQRIRVALRLAASSLHHSTPHLGECFPRRRARLGAPKAITAMAHKLARIIWHLVTYRVSYDESIFAQREELKNNSLDG